VTFTTSGDRPPPGFTDRAPALDTHNLTTIGRAAQQLVGSLDAGLGLAQGTTSYVWAGDRIVRGWAIELLLAGLLVPYLVAVVDLFALCRRRRIAVLPAARSLGNRVAFWLFAGLVFAVFGALGAWPTSPARPPNPALPSSGDWPVLALIALALVCMLGWLVARDRLVPRRLVVEEEQLAGETAALVGAGIVALLVLATNPFALLFVLPPLHAWLWLPQLRTGSRLSRWALLLVGLIGPALPLLSLALRFGLGVDTPWYALQLAAVGWVPVPTVAIVLCGAACTAQLVACIAGRYAPYPTRRERRRLGPGRTLLRSIVLTRRSQIGR
jgi:hypothetical protein